MLSSASSIAPFDRGGTVCLPKQRPQERLPDGLLWVDTCRRLLLFDQPRKYHPVVDDEDGGEIRADRQALETQIARDVRALGAGSDRISRFFASRHDVSNNDLDALLHIIVSESAGSPITPSELGERLGVSGAAITYRVDRMIESGHIRRDSDPNDRRKVILRFSDHGMSVGRDFFGPLGMHTRTAMADLPDDDLAAAHRVFAALATAMDSYRAELENN
jgi:DNA-binding MarR family transcriptional regulator